MGKKQSMMCDDIVVAKRHRKDMGDLQKLATSIDDEGLLQAVGVNMDDELVFGERRLKACHDILGWDWIDVRVVNVSSLVAGEYAENEVRKDFTVMERTAIGLTLEAEMGERRGGDQKSEDAQIKPDNCPGRSSAGDTRDIVAKKVGFGSGKEYERAKKVEAKGSAELKAAVDSGEVAISKAAELTSLPKAEQTKAVEGGKKAVKEAARKAIRAKAPKTSSKPPKAFPVSDHIDNWLGHIVTLGEDVKREYGGTKKMLTHPGWNQNDTESMLGLVRAILSYVTELEKEMSDHVNVK